LKNKIHFKTFAFILNVLIILLFSACNHSDKYTKEIKQLDSLSMMLDSAEMKIIKIDTLKINKYTIEIKTNLRDFEVNNKDSISNGNTILLSDYGRCYNPLIELNKAYSEQKHEIEESKEQIENLIHDLKINKVDEKKVTDYFMDERLAANKSIQMVIAMENVYQLYVKKYDEYNPKILDYIKKIKTKK
jgi:hypothetical protein